MSSPALAVDEVPGEPGVWIIVAGDIAVFLVLFGTYLHYRHERAATFAAGQMRLTPAFGVLDTVLLVTSSLAVVAATRAHRERRPEVAGRALAIAIGLGSLFVLSKAVEWTVKVHAGHVPDSNAFFALYFVLTGLHLLHVLLGLLALGVARGIARRAEPREQDGALVGSAAVFWHMVDLLWLLLFALVYFVH